MEKAIVNPLGSKCVSLLVSIVNACLEWWDAIIGATGLWPLWVGVVVMVALFSIVLVPMRSGQLLGGGAIGTFTSTRINTAKRNRRMEQNRNTPQVRYHVHTHTHSYANKGK